MYTVRISISGEDLKNIDPESLIPTSFDIETVEFDLQSKKIAKRIFNDTVMKLHARERREKRDEKRKRKKEN